jgi:hypothetical protein
MHDSLFLNLLGREMLDPQPFVVGVLKIVARQIVAVVD